MLQEILARSSMPSIPIPAPPVHMDTDTVFARVFGRHVLVHLFDDAGQRIVPTCSDEHAAFYARLAASYGRRVLQARETAVAHEAVVRSGFDAICRGFGFRLLRDR